MLFMCLNFRFHDGTRVPLPPRDKFHQSADDCNTLPNPNHWRDLSNCSPLSRFGFCVYNIRLT